MVSGVVNPNMAANAYANSQKITGIADTVKDTGMKTVAANEDSFSFADLLKTNVQQSVETMKAGESMSAQAVTGKADLTDVVQAITSAELTLQTVVAVRDRMISAYQEIMRMPI